MNLGLISVVSVLFVFATLGCKSGYEIHGGPLMKKSEVLSALGVTYGDKKLKVEQAIIAWVDLHPGYRFSRYKDELTLSTKSGLDDIDYRLIFDSEGLLESISLMYGGSVRE